MPPQFHKQFHAHNATAQKLPVLGFHSWGGRERERPQTDIYAPTCLHTCKLPMPIWLNVENDYFPYQTKGTRAPISLADNLIIYLHPQSACPSISAIPGFSDKAKRDTWTKQPPTITTPLNLFPLKKIPIGFWSSFISQSNHIWCMLFLPICPPSYLAQSSYLFSYFLHLPHPP